VARSVHAAPAPGHLSERTAGGRLQPRAGPAAGARIERILALQRDAGNAAVTAAFGVARQVVLMASDLVDGTEAVLGFDAWYALKSRLVYALWEVGTLEINVNTALIEAEVARLRAEVAAMREENDRTADHTAGHPGTRPTERLRVLAELTRGINDEVELTDRVFLARHPEREADPLRPGDPADAGLISEWRRIRRQVVAPVLASELGKIARASRRRGAPSGGSGASADTPVA